LPTEELHRIPLLVNLAFIVIGNYNDYFIVRAQLTKDIAFRVEGLGRAINNIKTNIIIIKAGKISLLLLYN
jgi:hypothetical protein